MYLLHELNYTGLSPGCGGTLWAGMYTEVTKYIQFLVFLLEITFFDTSTYP